MKDRFFTKLDWAAFWAATLITFAVYFFTLGPSVGLEDSGELATAAANLGVPHPPGYPFWTFCCWIFCRVFSFVTYMGHPTPAWAVSLCSATFGAFAAGFTAMLICRSGRDFIGGEADAADGSGWRCLSPSGVLAFGGGVAGALTFSLSPVEWSQSTIVEIYSLNAFFLMWVFLLTYRWMRKPSDRILYLTMFVFGLGLTNYQVLLFAIVPLVLVIMMTRIALFRDIATVLIPMALTYQVLKIGQLVRADVNMSADAINKHAALVGTPVVVPSTTALVLALVLVVGGIVAGAVMRAREDHDRALKAVLGVGGGGAALMLLAALVFTSKTTFSGIDADIAPLVSPVRYAVIAALLAGSVVAAVAATMTGDERVTGERSKRFLIAAGVFAVIAVVAAQMVPAAGSAGYRGPVYPWGKSSAVFWVLIAALFALGASTRRGLAFAIPAAGFHIALYTLLSHGAMNGLTHPASWWFGWPLAWNFVLLALAAAALPYGRCVAFSALAMQLGAAFYVYMPIVSDLRNPPMNWGYPRTWEGFKHAIMRGQYEAIGIPSFGSFKEFCSFMGKQMGHYFADVKLQFTDLLIPFALVPFAVGHFVVDKAHRRAFWQWMAAALSCFFMMSFLLILLANVKGDIQDGFIQKVKFISSHAMIALWIGYGLVFAGALVLAKRARSLMNAVLLAAVMIAVAAVYPIMQNYCDDQMVFELGGCEQNGHTFGWQFGAYQLEGAKAIRAQLTADEEPLPDPDYPPAMEPFSIFFGGTDPGRFVPTYMIYSADYRPDIYLITQNALADDTYMSVERDLYGDEIWIPSRDDCADAFNVYVDEVQRGVRQPNGEVKIENGRVQVTGALGVMEINGILTRMMFEHDRRRHAFYVEESYVIPWMYPFLSPHGLIMKINADETGYDQQRAERDNDFWDWYVRRLLSDSAYRRDFAAQKSFSKLRAALAGLYIHQGRYYQGSQAFREACILYPISPEACFRYAQECLLPLRKQDVVLELMDYTDLMDPNNHRTGSLRGFINTERECTEQMAVLGPKLKAGTITPSEIFRLSLCYQRIGRVREAGQLLAMGIDAYGEASAAELRTAASLLLEADQTEAAERTLNRYLKLVPAKDAVAWCELARIQWKAGKSAAALTGFQQAVVIDGRAVQELLMREDKVLIEIYDAWYKQVQARQLQQRKW